MQTRLIAALVAAGFMLTGCQAGGMDSLELPDTDDQAVEVPQSPPAEPAPGDQSPENSPQLALTPCDDGVKSAIDQTIGNQTQAFRDGDFEAAYALASPSFQAGITVDVFASLIRLNYPQLLTADNARSGSCEADIANGVATILVRFETSSDPAYTLRYVVELVEGQWRVSGANQETVADTVA
jgi:hypothetical protein